MNYFKLIRFEDFYPLKQAIMFDLSSFYTNYSERG